MLTFWLMNQDIPWEQNMISTWIIVVETKFIDIGRSRSCQLMLKSKVNFKTKFLLAQSTIMSDQTMISIQQTKFFLQFTYTYLHMIWPIVQMQIFVQTLVESWIIMSIILKEFGPHVVQKISRYLLMKKSNKMEIFVQTIMHVMIHF